VEDAIQDGITERGLADDIVPGDSESWLADDQHGAAAVTILDDPPEIAPLAG
jgi:hypothetical protein